MSRGYKEFHGHGVRWEKSVSFHIPKELVRLGRVHAIEYECDKLNGGGDGTMALYRHVFETPADLCMDERGKVQLYILGKKVKVTDAGIEN